MSPAKRKLLLQSAIAVLLIVLVMFLTGVAMGYLEASGRDVVREHTALWVMLAFTMPLFVVVFWISAKWMSAIDEAAREAHKWAWFWGGSGGMAVGLAALVLAALPQAAAIRIPAWYAGRTDPAAYAATGAFAILFLMIIGYGVAWAWWWLGRR